MNAWKIITNRAALVLIVCCGVLLQQGCATTYPGLDGSSLQKGSAGISIDKNGKVKALEYVVDDSGKTKKAEKAYPGVGETVINTSAIVFIQTKENPCWGYICGNWGCFKYPLPCPPNP